MAMMTGRVLLVCALCVLWCGAGGRCDEGLVEIPAGGKGALGSTGTSVPGPGVSVLRIDVPNVNQSKETSAVKSFEGNEVKTDQQDAVDGVEDERNENSSEHLEETMEDGPGKERTEPPLQNAGQKEIQPPQLQVNLPQKAQPLLQQPQPHTQQQKEAKEGRWCERPRCCCHCRQASLCHLVWRLYLVLLPSLHSEGPHFLCCQILC
ncbi:mucin-associated surface protein [Trypanosoma cruzi cruzi]|nr:mucin-associated surface protein [Trypanosoma cruzi cruzi]